jgi:deazaflavin-dependent oxidoreductase (nitroreductase family)
MMSATGLARMVRRVVSRIETWEVRVLGWSVLSVLLRTPVLVLETGGRRTGRARRTTLACTELDGQLLVVGGAGGQSRVPDWVANLRADPTVRVTRRRRVQAATAVELVGEDREAVWPALVERWPRIAGYEARAGRAVPVFELVPS